MQRGERQRGMAHLSSVFKYLRMRGEARQGGGRWRLRAPRISLGESTGTSDDCSFISETVAAFFGSGEVRLEDLRENSSVG